MKHLFRKLCYRQVEVVLVWCEAKTGAIWLPETLPGTLITVTYDADDDPVTNVKAFFEEPRKWFRWWCRVFL